MKKYMLIAVVVALSVFNVVVAFAQDLELESKQKCDSLAGCGSNAACSGRGTPSGCTIVCEDRVIIECPHA